MIELSEFRIVIIHVPPCSSSWVRRIMMEKKEILSRLIIVIRGRGGGGCTIGEREVKIWLNTCGVDTGGKLK